MKAFQFVLSHNRIFCGALWGVAALVVCCQWRISPVIEWPESEKSSIIHECMWWLIDPFVKVRLIIDGFCLGLWGSVSFGRFCFEV